MKETCSDCLFFLPSFLPLFLPLFLPSFASLFFLFCVVNVCNRSREGTEGRSSRFAREWTCREDLSVLLWQCGAFQSFQLKFDKWSGTDKNMKKRNRKQPKRTRGKPKRQPRGRSTDAELNGLKSETCGTVGSAPRPHAGVRGVRGRRLRSCMAEGEARWSRMRGGGRICRSPACATFRRVGGGLTARMPHPAPTLHHGLRQFFLQVTDAWKAWKFASYSSFSCPDLLVSLSSINLALIKYWVIW